MSFSYINISKIHETHDLTPSTSHTILPPKIHLPIILSYHQPPDRLFPPSTSTTFSPALERVRASSARMRHMLFTSGNLDSNRQQLKRRIYPTLKNPPTKTPGKGIILLGIRWGFHLWIGIQTSSENIIRKHFIGGSQIPTKHLTGIETEHFPQQEYLMYSHVNIYQMSFKCSTLSTILFRQKI